MGYYELLQVSKSATDDEILQNYLSLARRLHPERHPFFMDRAFEAFKKLSEAFDVLSNPSLRDVYDDSGSKGLNKKLEEGKISRSFGFDKPFFSDDDISGYTYERAKKLFDDAVKKGKPDLTLEKEDDLLKASKDFEDFFKNFNKGNEESKMWGTTQQYSSISRDGKKVTVTRTSKLNPDGTIKTEVSECYDDGTGKPETKSVTSEEKWKGISQEKEKKGITQSQEKQFVTQ